MDHEFWTQRWADDDIGFHQPDVHDMLAANWPPLQLPAGSPVLVPLCGKSLDMVWLANAGHKVIGVELSQVAIDAFFAERGLDPESELKGGFTVKRSGPYELWCGDIFQLPSEVVADVSAVYDRASLVALTEDLQERYATKLTDMLPKTAVVAIVGLTYPPEQMDGPPFSTPLARIAELFGGSYNIAIVEARDGLEASPNLAERGLNKLDEVFYVLRRKDQ